MKWGCYAAKEYEAWWYEPDDSSEPINAYITRADPTAKYRIEWWMTDIEWLDNCPVADMQRYVEAQLELTR